MPKFIGNRAPEGAIKIHDNATEHSIAQSGTTGAVRITYAQMLKLPATSVMYSLDTTDKGGIRTMAKRWYRWFSTVEAIQACPTATVNMRKRATASFGARENIQGSTRKTSKHIFRDSYLILYSDGSHAGMSWSDGPYWED